MSASPPLLTRDYRIGRFELTLSLPCTSRTGVPTTLLAEWAPERPTDLTAAERAMYMLARDSFLRDALHLIGGSRALVVS
jgi:hypothetical protein